MLLFIRAKARVGGVHLVMVKEKKDTRFLMHTNQNKEYQLLTITMTASLLHV